MLLAIIKNRHKNASISENRREMVKENRDFRWGEFSLLFGAADNAALQLWRK